MSDYEASPYDWVADHVQRYESSEGTDGVEFNGFPCVVLTTIGRKTGKTRKSPLIRITDGDGYVVIASMGGQPTHPVWYLNLAAESHVVLQDGPSVGHYFARTTEGAERDRLWQVAIGVYPEYTDYQARCERQIPVVALDPR